MLPSTNKVNVLLVGKMSEARRKQQRVQLFAIWSCHDLPPSYCTLNQHSLTLNAHDPLDNEILHPAPHSKFNGSTVAKYSIKEQPKVGYFCVCFISIVWMGRRKMDLPPCKLFFMNSLIIGQKEMLRAAQVLWRSRARTEFHTGG